MATKEEKKAAKEVKQAEKAEIAQVKAAQEAEKIALKSVGASKDVIKAEEKANKIELANAKTTLAPAGRQTLLTDGQVTFLSSASAYSGDTATQVNTLLNNAANKYTELGITNVSKSGDTTIGLGLDKLVKYDLGQAGNQVTKTVERAQQYVGKTFTPEQIAAEGIKIKEVKGAPGLYQYKTGETGNNVYTFFRKDENGNYVGTGVNRTSTPQDDGGFFSSSLGQALMIGGVIALSLTPGGQAFATQIGTTLSGGVLTGTSAQALGLATIRGVSTGVITGDVEKGLIAAAISGAGSALNLSGELGNFMDSINLGDYKDALGVIGGNTSEATMAAVDAANQAAQGLSASQIASNLVSSGISNTAANVAANLAVQGATTSAITSGVQNALTQTGAFDMGGAAGTGLVSDATTTAGQTGLTSLGNGAFDVAGNPDVLGGSSAGMFTNAGAAAAGTAVGASTGAATGAATGSAAGTAAGTIGGTVASNLVNNIANGLLNKDGLLNNLLNAGIDYARADAIASNLTDQAKELQAQAAKTGQAAQVPFTPFTLTTGTGRTEITPGGATSMLTPELQALQQQQIGLAGQTFGAINPAQASQQMYSNLEALAAPGRQREQEKLLSTLNARGLLGIGRNLPTAAGTVAGVNPYMESLLSAQEQARLQQSLTAQQYGTSEALRQQQLGQGFQTGALSLDKQALDQLTAARGLTQDQINLALKNAEARRVSEIEGLKVAAPLYLNAAGIRSGQIAGVANQAQNLFGNLFNTTPQTTMQDLQLFGQSWGGTVDNPWYG